MLYDEEIPVLETGSEDSEYERIKEKFSHHDSTYVFNGLVKERRFFIEKAFKISEKFLDSDFKSEIKREGNFFNRLWELQLCTILLHNGYKLIEPPRCKKSLARPDFCIEHIDGSKIWIEATCPQLGPLNKKPQMVPGQLYTRESNIFDELQLSAPRIINSTIEKYKKLDSYKNNPDFSSRDKFILAINTDQISHHEPAEMAKELVLYGMGLMYIKQSGESGRHFHDEIVGNVGGKKVQVPTALFHRNEYSHITAVMTTNCWFDFGDDFVDGMSARINTYFNHNASNGLCQDYINFGTKHTMVCEGGYCKLEHFTNSREVSC